MTSWMIREYTQTHKPIDALSEKKPDTPHRAARDLVHLIELKFITNFPPVFVSVTLLIHAHLSVYVCNLHMCT